MSNSLLDDVMKRLSGMSPAEIAELEKNIEKEANEVWLPNAGPQYTAFFHPADELLYGGQGGGGKTDLILGLAFTQHWNSLILRRQYVDTGGVIERAIEIHGSRDGYSGAIPPRLFTKDGRRIIFGAHKEPGDEQSFQGQAFDLKCVSGQTKVLMASGEYSEMQSIRQGDMVATLEGPRRVVRVLPVQRKPAVRIEVFSDCGQTLCYQDQSLTHEVLTPSGWASHSEFALSSPSLIFLSKGWRESLEFSRRYGSTSVEQPQYRGVKTGHCRPSAGFPPDFAARQRLCLARVVELQPPLGLSAAASCATHPRLRRPLLSCGRAALQRRPHEESWPLLARLPCALRSYGERFWLRLLDSLASCLFGNHQYDEHVRRPLDRAPGEADARACLPRSDGAGQSSPTCSEGDDQGRIPKCSPHTNTYAHPYTKETRRIVQGLSVDIHSLRSHEIGEADLYDIEVDEVNHYITAGGIINKNCFDEAVQHLESQIKFHLGWLRSTRINPDGTSQRCRAVLATNPPIDASGDWIIGRYRPWLDMNHPNPAKHGEMRWFITNPDGEDQEVDGPEPIEFTVNGDRRTYKPLSRTFIPAALRDNPYLINTGYQSQLDALPEPYRSAVRDGNFMAARTDAANQVIPTEWVIAAQNRWNRDSRRGKKMSAMGYDPAGGGRDSAELAMRYGFHYSEIVTAKGHETTDGSLTVALLFKHRRDNAIIVIDHGGGYAGQTVLRLKDNETEYVAYNGNHVGVGRDASGKLKFHNHRAEVWWKFREALDPDQPGGSQIELPPGGELRADLTAPTYRVEKDGIWIEAKESIKKKLGRSPGKGDAVVIAWHDGNAAIRKRDSESSGSRRTLPTHSQTTRDKSPLARRRGR